MCPKLLMPSTSAIFRRISLPKYTRRNHNFPLQTSFECSTAAGSNAELNRSHNCGQVNVSQVNSRVTLGGWLRFKRMSGSFLVLRDKTGSVQLNLTKQKHLVQRVKDNCPLESVLQVQDEMTRMQHRYLDLRRPAMLANLAIRSQLVQKLRHFAVVDNQFLEIETPILFRRTPGGAAEFPVPSSSLPGLFYALPQSPQQFKQLLMVAGVDKYFQIARCFRDEGITSDRQPEFTQVDLEMSFTSAAGVMRLVEAMLVAAWPHPPTTLDLYAKAVKAAPDTPFPSMTYAHAMQRFGTDKPDTRFGCELEDLSAQDGCDNEIPDSVVKQQPKYLIRVTVPNTNKSISKTFTSTKLRSLLKMKSYTDVQLTGKHLQVHHNEDQSAVSVYVMHDNKLWALKLAGTARLLLADHLEANNVHIRDRSRHHCLWVTDFPLFELDDNKTLETGREVWKSVHHPFTAPISGHADWLWHSDRWGHITAQHYDLVMDGNELGGGSVRIHNSDTQRYVLESILGEDCTELEHLLKALSMGAPPHAGFALGLDRFIALLLQTKSIRDVIAFPKTAEGRDRMSDAPCEWSNEQLKPYAITSTLPLEDS